MPAAVGPRPLGLVAAGALLGRVPAGRVSTSKSLLRLYMYVRVYMSYLEAALDASRGCKKNNSQGCRVNSSRCGTRGQP